MELQEFVPYVVQSIKATDGYTLSYGSMDYEPMVEDDGMPYVNTEISILGTEFAPQEIYSENNRLPIAYNFNIMDDVKYYQVGGNQYALYGVRNGLIVAYADSVSDIDGYPPEVHTILPDEFNGIAPKIITENNINYLVWKVNNG